jgi:lauroyl/myristoyl acyltransferase
LNASKDVPVGLPAPDAGAATRRDSIRRRWTLHKLNNGAIFSATYRLVSVLPRRVSYGIGRAGTWMAWRMMRETRAAIAGNLRPLFPGESERSLEARARGTLGAYANDVIDFIRSLRTSDANLQTLFDYTAGDAQLILDLMANERGLILITGHYGNWEAGGVFIRRIMKVPVAILAMSEPNPTVNRLRREIRDLVGADTIEVGQSIDTALQIRRRLAGNGVVAVLMDRYLGRDRVEVEFLGRRALFLRTPALMAFMTGAPLLPCFIERLRPGRFAVRAGVPIIVNRDIPRDEAIQAAAQDFANQLSARVRTHPEFWYQFYRYWDVERTEPVASGFSRTSTAG